MTNLITVSALNKYIKSTFDENKLLSDLYVKGEISNFVNHYRSGHYYFSLKDENAALKCVMFSSYSGMLRFLPENGMSVIAHGYVSLYEKTGEYQFYVNDMQPDGLGSLNLAYEQLKNKLYAEGLFDESHKLALPKYPENIGIVTAAGAAALQDILYVFNSNYNLAKLRIYPVLVQGNKASESIARALKYIEKEGICELVILARGGGSLEDLWAFNEEKTVRAVYDCSIPIITGVGHEVDYTLCDFAADFRGATPTAAAALACRNTDEIHMELSSYADRIKRVLWEKLNFYQQSMKKYTEEYLTELITERISEEAEKKDRLSLVLSQNVNRYIMLMEKDLINVAKVFESLNPLNVLTRGYTVTTVEDKSLDKVKTGDIITTLSDKYIIKSEVREVKEQTEL